MKKSLLYAQFFLIVFVWTAVSFAANITGYVYQEDGKTPVSGAVVDIYTERCHGGHMYGEGTDENGFFEFKDLPTGGQYILQAAAGGSGQPYVNEWYDNVPLNDCNSANFVSVNETVSFSMELGGSISGTVTNAADSQPFSGVWVMAHRYDTGEWGNGAHTDDQGNYTIQGLRAGNYRVQVDTGGANILEEYYNETHDWNTASRVTVTAGNTTERIDMELDYGFPHEASVINLHQADDTFATLYFFDVEDYEGDLPGDFTSVTVTTPVSAMEHDLVWDPDEEEFSTILTGPPELGVHTFTVTTVEGQMTTTDYQYVNKSIPVPPVTAMSPAEGASVTSKTPTFTWAPVALEETPLYYSLEVVNVANGDGNDTDFTMGMTALTAPVGALDPGTYRWRVIVADNDEGAPIQNAALSDWVEFTVSGSQEPHSALPAIHPNDWNGLSWTGGNAFACSVKVIDLDGVSFDGSSHTLTVTAPDGANFPDGAHVKTVGFDSPAGPSSGYYWLYVGGGTPAYGEYTFTVTDPDGNQTTLVEQVDVTPLNGPLETSLSPSNIDEYITATFDNVLVNGGQPYEDFNVGSIDELDPAKWKWPGGASIENNKLKLDARDSVGRAHSGISFADVELITSIQAEIAITDASSAPSKSARIAGAFFNDGSNTDFWVSLWHKGSSVGYTLSKQWINQQGTYQWETVISEDLLSVSSVEPITVSVDWHEGSKTLTFTATNAAQTQSETKTYVHMGPVYPAIYKELSLQARINLITSTTPTFSWAPVSNASRYRFRIYSYDNRHTVWRGYTGNETTYTVPPGVLEPGAYYRYRVEAWDKPDPLSVDNYSRTPTNSDYYRFYTEEAVPEAPSIDLNGAGVHAYTEDNGTIPVFWVRVDDRQGVPDNIDSVKVTFPVSGKEEFLALDHTDSSTRGYYLLASEEPIEDGTYTFTVSDKDGNSASITDDLINNLIAATDNLSAVVGPKDILVSWDSVPDALFYRINLYDATGERVERINVDAAGGPSFSIPRGLLEEGGTYRYRIQAYREWFSDITGNDTEGNMDNSSQAPSDLSLAPSFVLALDGDRDGLPDSLENQSGSCTFANDADSDEDGILDGNEDRNRNGIVDTDETNPCEADSDDDGLYDGTEIGLTEPQNASATDESAGFFVADEDSDTRTDPTNSNSDGDRLLDGEEDLNKNGRVDAGESNPLDIDDPIKGGGKSLPFIPLLLLTD